MAKYIVRGWVARPIEIEVEEYGKNQALRKAIKTALRKHEDGEGPQPIWTDTPFWEAARKQEA